MAIIPSTQVTSVELLILAASILKYLSAAAESANAMPEKLLALSDSALEQWLNAQTPEQVQALFSAHSSVSAHINDAIGVTAEQLRASGQSTSHSTCSTATFQQRLHDQGRAVVQENGQFKVVKLPPPEPVVVVVEEL